MKKYISSAVRLVDQFLDFHEDENNPNRDNGRFDKMYDILDKYGDESENVDVVFERATPEDQLKMIDLISYRRPAKVGSVDYCRDLYYNALEGDAYDSREANQAVVDVFEALFAANVIDEKTFRTDL